MLDELISSKIFDGGIEAPFSTTIASAWLVVDRIIGSGYHIEIFTTTSKEWEVVAYNRQGQHCARAKTPAMAICLAGLKVL